GRPDPPADRASGEPARHAEPAGLPPGRHDRDRRMLGAGPGHAGPALDPRPHPPSGAAGATDPHGRKSLRPGRIPARAGGGRAALRATGSEVSLALEARDRLQADGIGTAGVSLPCWELFDAQPASYREEVLGPAGVRVAVEAASPFGWERYVGPEGAVIGLTGFGASAPAGDLYRHFGITAERIVAAVKARV